MNDGSTVAPRLKVYLNLSTLAELGPESRWRGAHGAELIAQLKSDGFDGVQGGDAAEAHRGGLGFTSSGRVNRVGEADPLARRVKDAGGEAVTLHVGTGFEGDSTIDALVRDIIAASDRVDLPLYIETHRATITQDIWRTIEFTRRFPDVRFNADFSHYYTGHELPYGDIDAKWRLMQPIFDRVRFIHGRIGNTSCMQVDVGDGFSPVPQGFGMCDFMAHYREMWTRAMVGFLSAAKPGDYLVFAPEILGPQSYYARKFSSPDRGLCEESDRYAQALVYARIARECFVDAKRRSKKSSHELDSKMYSRH